MKLIACLALLFAVGFASAARAQSLVFASSDDKIYPVRQVYGMTPKVKKNGKLVSVYNARFFLQNVPFFQDGFIQVDDFEVSSQSLVVNGASQINPDLVMSGFLTATRSLQNCFLVVELTESDSKQKGVALVELPRLEASKRQSFHVRLPLASAHGSGHYQLHIFSDAGEIRHSKMMSGLSFASDHRTASHYLEMNATKSAKPVLVLSPAYPAKLAATTNGGHAEVQCQISAEGDVIDAKVTEASQPEFGEAALAAVKQWYFTPAVKDHQFIVFKVLIPISFEPQPKTAGGS